MSAKELTKGKILHDDGSNLYEVMDTGPVFDEANPVDNVSGQKTYSRVQTVKLKLLQNTASIKRTSNSA